MLIAKRVNKLQTGSLIVSALTLWLVPVWGLVQSSEEGSTAPEFAVIAPRAPNSLLLDGIFRDGLMVAVGERGHVLWSEDRGETWLQGEVPTGATLTGVYFHDRNTGWAVGHDAVIIKTTDAGRHWELKFSAPEDEAPLLDVWFKDADHGFAVGGYGLFLDTTDGGDTWTRRSFEAQPLSTGEDDTDEDPDVEADSWWDTDVSTDLHLNHIVRSEMGRLFIAAEAGTIYRSDDYGDTWISLPSPYVGSFFGTLPLVEDQVLLFGLRGHLFRSEDAGANWQPVDSATQAMLTDGIRLGDGTIVLAGLAGVLLTSTDGGQSFALHQQPDRKGYTKVLAGTDDALILIGEAGLKKIRLDALTGGGP